MSTDLKRMLKRMFIIFDKEHLRIHSRFMLIVQYLCKHSLTQTLTLSMKDLFFSFSLNRMIKEDLLIKTLY